MKKEQTTLYRVQRREPLTIQGLKAFLAARRERIRAGARVDRDNMGAACEKAFGGLGKVTHMTRRQKFEARQAKRLAAAAIGLVALFGAGCGATFRTVGMEDPSVEMVRALASTQTATIKALTEALTRAAATACPVPEGGR